jgi:type IV secretion system protein VirB10
MPEPNEKTPATVPDQPESKPPLKKSMPVVIALVVIIGLIGIANLSSLLSGNRKNAPASAIPMRPAAPNAQQVNSFESQQQLQAQRDAEARQHQQELNAALQQLQQTEGAPGPEAAGAPPMTAAQRASIYGDSPNAPQRTSNMSQAQAEAKQKELAKEKQQQDAINSDTVAIDFERTNPATPASVVSEAAQETAANLAGGAAVPGKPTTSESKKDGKGSFRLHG